MRENCKHFQSRTYSTGEVARFCILDLAPEAPWRCPADCPRFEPRMADAGWIHGSLVEPAIEDEPEVPGSNVAEVLDHAEDIINASAPEALAEFRAREAAAAREEARKDASGGGGLRRWWRRRR